MVTYKKKLFFLNMEYSSNTPKKVTSQFEILLEYLLCQNIKKFKKIIRNKNSDIGMFYIEEYSRKKVQQPKNSILKIAYYKIILVQSKVNNYFKFEIEISSLFLEKQLSKFGGKWNKGKSQK